MVNVVFDEVWGTIGDLAGEEFKTATGKKFRFTCEDNSLTISQKGGERNRHINEGDFFKVYQYMNQYVIADASDLDSVCSHKGENEIDGCTYIWSILNDKRVHDRYY